MVRLPLLTNMSIPQHLSPFRGEKHERLLTAEPGKRHIFPVDFAFHLLDNSLRLGMRCRGNKRCVDSSQ
ncbi:MAG: hypothetical protein KatS3mg105_3531 [Gemmatales bacterium]|nr:MAG: hypothetical protein KatS3mg105_3531 [Gemmatales bacterium]